MSTTPYFAVEQIKRTRHFNMDSDHFHESYEIYYLLSGERYYYINDRVYALQVGDLLFINKNHLHRTMSKGRSSHERILVNFDDLFIEPLLSLGVGELPLYNGESFLLRPDVHEQGRIEDLFHTMLREQKEAGSGSTEYLNKEYRQKLTLPEIAEQFYISETYLCRIFKQTTGFTVIEYLNYIRIREAQTLLRETDDKITRIAEETGFDSIAHFGRVFKQIVKRSPLQYRKQNQI
ncbi:AraC family transcriptional regulator [Paenibacillus motobuensis]|uniref:AraC family transcriptional regulator n=1 Tax=Paenibacillus motobuensis TaxID=295324 RepID=A0ABP3IN13_9BACL